MSLIKLIVAILLLSTIQTVEPDLKDKIINVTFELKNDVVYSANNLVESVKSHLNNSSDYFNDTKTFIDNASDVVEDKVVEWWPSVKKFLISLGVAILFGLAAALIGFVWFLCFLCVCGFTTAGIREGSPAACFQSIGAKGGIPFVLIVSLILFVGGFIYFIIVDYKAADIDWSFGKHMEHMWTALKHLAIGAFYGLGFGVLVAIAGALAFYAFLLICGCNCAGISGGSPMACLQSSGATGGREGAVISAIIFFFVGIVCYYVFLNSKVFDDNTPNSNSTQLTM